MAIYQLGERRPEIATDVYVDASACVIGEVLLRAGASVWCNASLRGDDDRIEVGEQSNVQDNCVLHADAGFPVILGARVTLGHLVMAHGCTIGDESLIGMGSVILNGARIGRQCLVAAGALITEGKEFPDRSLILGRPAKAVRSLDDTHLAMLARGWQHYVQMAAHYRATGLQRIG